MKRNILGISLGVLALSGLLFVSCDKDTKIETVIASVPTLTVSNLTVASAGGQYSVSYSVSNAAADGVVSATADVSWISGVTVNSSAIAVTIAENTSDDLRSGNVTIEYTYTEDGVSRTISEKAGIVQYGAEEPSLSVQPNAVSAAYGGGTYSFSYEITNAVDDGEISCAVDAACDWITGFNYATYGKVSFTVAANDSDVLRTATITVTYAYTGATLTKEVTVIQDHPGDGTGGGGGDGSLVGTYTAGGYAYVSSGTDAYTTWTLKIYKYDGSATVYPATYTGGFDYYIDGLVPGYTGQYDYYGDHRCSAAAYINENGNLVVPTQVLNTTVNTSSGATYNLGYTPAVSKSSSGWSYNYGWPDLTFTYNASNGCWEADYGVFLGGFTSTSLTEGVNSGFSSFFDVVSPGDFQFTKDGDLGGGGGDYPNYSDMTGTYSCTGYGRISGGYDYATWDMYITAKSETEYYVYCLTPYAGGVDVAGAGSNYWAVGHWGTETTFVIPSQVCKGQVNSSSGSTYYWGYTPCTEYDGSSWYYSSQYPDLTFTKTGDDTWESDYGVFAAGCTGYDITTFASYFGVVAPTIKATKTSNTVPTAISAAANSGRALSAEAYTNLKVSSAPASSTGFVTRSLGTIRQGDAKLAK